MGCDHGFFPFRVIVIAIVRPCVVVCVCVHFLLKVTFVVASVAFAPLFLDEFASFDISYGYFNVANLK